MTVSLLIKDMKSPLKVGLLLLEVPQVTTSIAEIAKGNDAGLEPRINLVGLFVGNGCTGNKTPSVRLCASKTILRTDISH